ncbi:MAG: hypothetical protein Tsb009_01510 [Planctomycetaceae bacterium]
MSDLIDDSSIPDEAILWRRIPPNWVVFDQKTNQLRPSSQSFDNHRDGSGMSVVLANEVIANGRSEENVLEGHEGFGLVAINAGLARKLNQKIVRDPLPDEPAHMEICGDKTKGVKKAFARAAVWIVKPTSQ